MFDIVDEKSGMLSKLGSFWYKNLQDEALYTPNKLSHAAFYTRALKQADNIVKATVSGGYFKDFYKVIRFTPRDVVDNTISIDKNTLVLTILDQDNNTLVRDVHFTSEFGKITMLSNPLALFSGLRIMAASVILRKRNILCYPLGLLDVYGSVDEVLLYYKNNQSLTLFYKASALAAGMAVVLADDVVRYVVPLLDGKAYITASGRRYDAPYEHSYLTVGSLILKGLVIGEEKYKLIQTKDEVPVDVQSIELLNSCPVPGICVPNSVITIYLGGKFKPAYTGDNLLDYLLYIQTIGPALLGTLSATQNGVLHFRNTVAKNRCAILYIKDMEPNMYKKLMSFINANAPIGCVLTKAKIS